MPHRPPENTLHTRDAFFAREQAIWNTFLHVWSDLPDEILLEPGASGSLWSIKDILNHAAAWQEAAQRMIPEIAAGRWAHLGMNTARFNAYHYTLDRDRPLDESRSRLFHSRLQLLAILEPLSDEQILNEYGRQQIGWWAKWNTYAHYEHHCADIRTFRTQRGIALRQDA